MNGYLAVKLVHVLADWLFTTPAVVVQLVSGLWLAGRLGIPGDSAWLAGVVGRYAFGIPAFAMVAVLFVLMICKPGMYTSMWPAG